MVGAVLIGLFLALGYAAQAWAQVPLPPNVIGLVLLFVALRLGIVQLAWVEKVSHLLLRHMMLFFIPSVVGAAFLATALAGQWTAAVVGLLLSTVFSLLAAGWTAERLLPAGVMTGSPGPDEPGPETLQSTEDVGSAP